MGQQLGLSKQTDEEWVSSMESHQGAVLCSRVVVPLCPGRLCTVWATIHEVHCIILQRSGGEKKEGVLREKHTHVQHKSV